MALGIVAGSNAISRANTQRRALAAPRLSVVVHRGGGRVVAGDYDNARRWVSHTVKTTGRSEVTMPAFEGSDAEWRALMSCTRSQYAGLPVDIVEKPPATGDYLLVVVGGVSQYLGQARLWGLASAGAHTVVPNGVGFVFSADHRGKDRSTALCITLTHELGHMIGLEHSSDCNDVMSTTVECKRRDNKHKLRGFQQANWSTLASSLATWSKASTETRITDAATDKTQKAGVLALPLKH